VLDLVVSHQGLPLKLELVKRILSTLVLPSPVPYRSLLRRFAALSSKSCAEVALRAQQLLEVSLLADMRAVVARALSGLDMFSVADGKLSPTAAAAMMTPFTASAAAAASQDKAAAALGGAVADLKVVARKATIREGVYAGLNSLLPPGTSLEGRLSMEGRVSVGGSSGNFCLADRLGGVGHTASPQRSSSGGPMTPHGEAAAGGGRPQGGDAAARAPRRRLPLPARPGTAPTLPPARPIPPRPSPQWSTRSRRSSPRPPPSRRRSRR
jgi:hypothetical protein